MKKIMILSFILFSFIKVFAQDTAILNVEVFNEFKKPISGEQIIFESEDGSIKVRNITNNNGEFKIHLLGGKKYNIKVKTIGDAKKYNTIEIPALEKGQKYSENLLTITIYESKSFTLDNVYFDSGKSSLKHESYKELNELYEFLSLKPQIKIEISGHTDNVGNDENNMLLSEKRAKSVKQFLINKGIQKERIVTKAYGETKPIASNDTEKGKSMNRRIEVLVVD